MPLPNASSAGDLVRCLDLDDFDLRLDRYRLIQPKADQLMARSLSKYSQLAPVVYCELEGALVLIDGFKRLRAARTLKGLSTLQARSLEVDEHGPAIAQSWLTASANSTWKHHCSQKPMATLSRSYNCHEGRSTSKE